MRDSCLADSPGVQRHSASVNAVHGIEYTSFISLGTMNLTPLIKCLFSVNWHDFVQNCSCSYCHAYGNQLFLRCQDFNMLA